jgi:hypothetical protein
VSTPGTLASRRSALFLIAGAYRQVRKSRVKRYRVVARSVAVKVGKCIGRLSDQLGVEQPPGSLGLLAPSEVQDHVFEAGQVVTNACHGFEGRPDVDEGKLANRAAAYAVELLQRLHCRTDQGAQLLVCAQVGQSAYLSQAIQTRRAKGSKLGELSEALQSPDVTQAQVFEPCEVFESAQPLNRNEGQVKSRELPKAACQGEPGRSGAPHPQCDEAGELFDRLQIQTAPPRPERGDPLQSTRGESETLVSPPGG